MPPLAIYFGMIAAALAVIALGLVAVVQASDRLSQASPREKTLLELQVESSREIRRALAVPVVVPPLPPITARPAREFRDIAAASERKMQVKLSQQALNAMAMEQGGTYRSSGHNYPVFDRHRPD